ncbi:MAG TPA: hypothetical protein VEP91_10715 [Solirubrobacterales bacterium]|nr:hypothetical protein [Solirubrobacterales bacterium]
MHKAIAGLAVAGALMLVAAGCGGGDDSTVSKQEYDQQLELVCNQGLKEREAYLEEVNRMFEEQGGKVSKAFQVKNLRKYVAIYQGTTAEIADIGFPEEDRRKAEELVQTREKAAAQVQADPLGSVESIQVIFKKTNQIAEDLEANSCAT